MKRILLGLITISLVSIIGIGATRAYFNSQGLSSNNTFATGTLDLKLSDTDESIQDSVTATWVGSNMVPGNTVTGILQLRNTGTIAANHIEIGTTNIVTEAASEPGNVGTVKMDTVLEITTLTYDGADLLSTLPDSNGNSIKDLDDMESYTFDNLSLTNLGTDHPLVMTVKLHSTMVVDQHQGDSVTTTLNVSLNQDISQ